MEASSWSGSSKRAKQPANMIVHCLVDGCNSDLRQCREYHRRHKVCEAHSKTPRVTIEGREQRFCQQCSRFHSLAEFDEGKRSCRKRLDGHNRRRRKPQPNSLPRTSTSLPANQQGARLLSFNTPQTFSSTVVSSSWNVVSQVEDLAPYHVQIPPPSIYTSKHNPVPESSSHSFRGGNQFQFMQEAHHKFSSCQQLLDPNNYSSCSSQKMFSDGALSLLSSATSMSRETGLSHMLQPQPEPQSIQPYSSSLGEYPFALEMENKPVVSAAGSDDINNASLPFQGMMFQDGSAAGGSHQMLTFRW